MDKTKSITVQSCEIIKDGVYGNKAWTLYRITDQDNVRYSSFQPLPEGTQTTITYTEEPSDTINPKTGKPYINRKIIPADQVKTPRSQPTADLASLEARLSKVEHILRENGYLS